MFSAIQKKLTSDAKAESSLCLMPAGAAARRGHTTPAGAAARRGHTTPQSENAGDRPPAVAQLQRPPRILLEIRVGRAIGLHVGFGFLMYLWKKILLFYEGHSGMNLCFPLVFVDMYRRVARQKAPKMDNPKGYCTGTAVSFYRYCYTCTQKKSGKPKSH
jgi:hypothetical protein